MGDIRRSVNVLISVKLILMILFKLYVLFLDISIVSMQTHIIYMHIFIFSISQLNIY